MVLNSAGERSVARTWSRAICDAYPTIEGLYYCSSMYSNQPLVALYERAVDALPPNPLLSLALDDARLARDLAGIAYDVGYTCYNPPETMRPQDQALLVRKDRLMVDVIQEHIEIVQEVGGPRARIAGHRISVEDIAVWHEKLGMSPDEIVHDYPTITLADVHAALAYYWDHRDEIERAITEDKAFVEEFRRNYTTPLERKLKRSKRD